jgi:hypothetical protein
MPRRYRVVPTKEHSMKRMALTKLTAPTVDTLASEEIMAWASPRARQQQAQRAAKARNTSGRRRCVDSTTCERDYSKAELELMHAMQEYKLRSGRMFPTWSEVLEVLQGLGYQKGA